MAHITQKHLNNKALVAFDHMRLSLSQLEWAYELNAVYKELLNNERDSRVIESGLNQGNLAIEESKEETKVNKKQK